MAIVSDEQVIKVLRQYNPWWRNPLAIKEENKPQKRLAYREHQHLQKKCSTRINPKKPHQHPSLHPMIK